MNHAILCTKLMSTIKVARKDVGYVCPSIVPQALDLLNYPSPHFSETSRQVFPNATRRFCVRYKIVRIDSIAGFRCVAFDLDGQR